MSIVHNKQKISRYCWNFKEKTDCFQLLSLSRYMSFANTFDFITRSEFNVTDFLHSSVNVIYVCDLQSFIFIIRLRESVMFLLLTYLCIALKCCKLANIFIAQMEIIQTQYSYRGFHGMHFIPRWYWVDISNLQLNLK